MLTEPNEYLVGYYTKKVKQAIDFSPKSLRYYKECMRLVMDDEHKKNKILGLEKLYSKLHFCFLIPKIGIVLILMVIILSFVASYKFLFGIIPILILWYILGEYQRKLNIKILSTICACDQRLADIYIPN